MNTIPIEREPQRLRHTVLAVDDDRLILDVYVIILAGDYKLIPRISPREALDLVKGGASIDLIISDLDMGEMTGVELLQAVHEFEVRSGRTHTKKILTTSQSETAVREALDYLRSNGVEVHYFRKSPYSTSKDELPRLIAQLISQREA
ncbi:response regulator [Candidatus Woesearchaeota archaeon]|nr:response regulator [Candidatus Woesearchaeota archaeon]